MCKCKKCGDDFKVPKYAIEIAFATYCKSCIKIERIYENASKTTWIMSKEEKIYEKAFSYYVRPSTYEKMSDKGWMFKEFPFGGGIKNDVLKTIKQLLSDKNKVRCGYMCTSIRGLHDYYIIYKKLLNETMVCK